MPSRTREIPCEPYLRAVLNVYLTILHVDIPEGSKVKYFYKKSPSAKGKHEIMSDAQKRDIEQNNLTCSKPIHSFTIRTVETNTTAVEYFHLTEVQERDMFQVSFSVQRLLLAEYLDRSLYATASPDGYASQGRREASIPCGALGRLDPVYC